MYRFSKTEGDIRTICSLMSFEPDKGLFPGLRDDSGHGLAFGVAGKDVFETTADRASEPPLKRAGEGFAVEATKEREIVQSEHDGQNESRIFFGWRNVLAPQKSIFVF